MKKLNKKGFTLIELLAVIVLLAIVAVVAGNAIAGQIAKGKGNTFVTSYNNVRERVIEQIADGDTPKPSAADYDLSTVDYDLSVVPVSGGYQITLTGNSNGTFKNVKISDYCGRAKGGATCTDGTTNSGPKIEATVSADGFSVQQSQQSQQ